MGFNPERIPYGSVDTQVGLIRITDAKSKIRAVLVNYACHLPHTYLFGYCCNAGYEWPSYLPDLVSAARGGYGASDTTRAEVGSGERLVNEGLVQLFELQVRLKPEPQRHTYDTEPK